MLDIELCDFFRVELDEKLKECVGRLLVWNCACHIALDHDVQYGLNHFTKNVCFSFQILATMYHLSEIKPIVGNTTINYVMTSINPLVVERSLVIRISSFRDIEQCKLFSENGRHMINSACEELIKIVVHTAHCSLGVLARVLEEVETSENLFMPRELINLIGDMAMKIWP